jgi:hypothetical protein
MQTITGTKIDGGGKYFYNTGFYEINELSHLVGGLLLVVLIMIDYWTFAYFPLEKGLLIQRSERTMIENAVIGDQDQ